MDHYSSLMEAIEAYTPSPVDLLRYLRFERRFHGDDFCADKNREDMYTYAEHEFWGTWTEEVPRDEDGFILQDEAYEWTTGEIDGFYSQGELAPFVRTMKRTEALKEELMAATWHPRRIERLLEIGGEAALDNFAGL